MRINAAARELARTKGERHLPGSYRLVTDDVYRARFLSGPLPIGASIWYHSFDGSWWLGKIAQHPDDNGRYVVRFLDKPGPALIDLTASAYNTALHSPCGSWCLPMAAPTPFKASCMANRPDTMALTANQDATTPTTLFIRYVYDFRPRRICLRLPTEMDIPTTPDQDGYTYDS